MAVTADRTVWVHLDDAALLAQCEVDTYRASGPGGQKRNKTSSAVRLRHRPSGLIVIAEESRSQHENKAKAIQRLRRAFALELREPLPIDSSAPGGLAEHPELQRARGRDGRLDLSPKHGDFWPAAAIVLDALAVMQARVAETSALLGVSTANLIDFLRSDPRLWQQANGWRTHFGHKPLQG